MCPMCWAAALASFAALLVVSALVVAGNDRMCLASALTLAIVLVLHRMEWLVAPMWCIVALSAAAVGRIVFLLCDRREELLIGKLWRRARAIAAQRCPRKATATSRRT